jgi:hypothetical protein
LASVFLPWLALYGVSEALRRGASSRGKKAAQTERTDAEEFAAGITGTAVEERKHGGNLSAGLRRSTQLPDRLALVQQVDRPARVVGERCRRADIEDLAVERGEKILLLWRGR